MTGKHKKSSKKSKHHKKEKKSKHRRKSSSESSSEDEWVEKPEFNIDKTDLQSNSPNPQTETQQSKRDDWLDMSNILLSASTSDKRKERELEKSNKRTAEQYDPSKCSRELNPYWKDGGSGLPNFKKPSDSLESDTFSVHREKKSENWRLSKRTSESNFGDAHSSSRRIEEKPKEPNISDSLDPNLIAAKLLKAEIMGNTKLVEELKRKLEEAKQSKTIESESDKEVILTQTNSKGYSRPLNVEDDKYGPRKKKKKVETHSGKERTSYYADDDKFSLKQMFEAEKYNTSDNINRDFAKIAGNVRKNDNLADLFLDEIRSESSSSKEVGNAVSTHERINRTLDECTKCFQSKNMLKHLMIEYNDHCYLYLPNFEPLVDGHCLISPIKHISCSLQLDEDEWTEINNCRLKLLRFFEKQDKSVIFFEIVKSFNKFPHMVLECVPVPKRKFDVAPIYFKKAIEESETEWSLNKKLISLKNKDVRRAIPKGLPYFFVNFGMNDGFAHVIEDHSNFPSNFAQEIIGGMLNIHHSKWRKPKREHFEDQKLRIQEFNKVWKENHIENK